MTLVAPTLRTEFPIPRKVVLCFAEDPHFYYRRALRPADSDGYATQICHRCNMPSAMHAVLVVVQQRSNRCHHLAQRVAYNNAAWILADIEHEPERTPTHTHMLMHMRTRVIDN